MLKFTSFTHGFFSTVFLSFSTSLSLIFKFSGSVPKSSRSPIPATREKTNIIQKHQKSHIHLICLPLLTSFRLCQLYLIQMPRKPSYLPSSSCCSHCHFVRVDGWWWLCWLETWEEGLSPQGHSLHLTPSPSPYDFSCSSWIRPHSQSRFQPDYSCSSQTCCMLAHWLMAEVSLKYPKVVSIILNVWMKVRILLDLHAINPNEKIYFKRNINITE